MGYYESVVQMITKQIVYIGDFYEKAMAQKDNFGHTNLFTTGFESLDKYLGGGYGRVDGYEVVLLYGPTGVGKSLVALNLLAPAIMAGKRIGLMILEDDMADVSIRLNYILGNEQYAKMNSSDSVLCIPEEALSKAWKLSELLELIEIWYTKNKIDVILLDHLQFAFEGAEALRGENEYVAQRVFMQQLNQLMKRMKKTIILVSHVSKGKGVGLDKVVGSSAIAQAATKAIEIDKKDKEIHIRMWKSRFSHTPSWPHKMILSGTKLKETGATNENPF